MLCNSFFFFFFNCSALDHCFVLFFFSFFNLTLSYFDSENGEKKGFLYLISWIVFCVMHLI